MHQRREFGGDLAALIRQPTLSELQAHSIVHYEHMMAFLVQSRDHVISTNTSSAYIHALESTFRLPVYDIYVSEYKHAITVMNSGGRSGQGSVPASKEISKFIYAAYFQTLSELSRRNFIDEYSIPKSQEISTLILSEDAFVPIQIQGFGLF